MPKKCPPGVICLENMTLFLLIIIIIFLSYIFFNNQKNIQYKPSSSPIIIKEKISLPDNRYNSLSSHLYFNQNDNIFNPYVPPLKNDNIYPNLHFNIPSIPINIPTQSVDSSYRQVGILNNLNGNGIIIQ